MCCLGLPRLSSVFSTQGVYWIPLGFLSLSHCPMAYKLKVVKRGNCRALLILPAPPLPLNHFRSLSYQPDVQVLGTIVVNTSLLFWCFR